MSQKFNGPLSTLDQMTNATLSPNDCLACEQTVSYDGMGLPISEIDKRYVGQAAGASGPLLVAAGTHVPTSGEVSAATLTIATGLNTIAVPLVQIYVTSNGRISGSDQAISFSGGNLTIDNGSTFALATTQTIRWIAFGA